MKDITVRTGRRPILLAILTAVAGSMVVVTCAYLLGNVVLIFVVAQLGLATIYFVAALTLRRVGGADTRKRVLQLVGAAGVQIIILIAALSWLTFAGILMN